MKKSVDLPEGTRMAHLCNTSQDKSYKNLVNTFKVKSSEIKTCPDCGKHTDVGEAIVAAHVVNLEDGSYGLIWTLSSCNTGKLGRQGQAFELRR